ncbi:hypothetical protein ACFVHI_24245 [Kitasatospora sp. NPDC127121]|uniref:hypothetical protein n=1 Tax=Kitasatospora sp. NPDC127121 TaxID=3345371 RepID=UPI00363DD310
MHKASSPSPLGGVDLPRCGSGWTKWRRRHATEAAITCITAAADPGRQATVLA